MGWGSNSSGKAPASKHEALSSNPVLPKKKKKTWKKINNYNDKTSQERV
jgi:hypothetical protein